MADPWVGNQTAVDAAAEAAHQAAANAAADAADNAAVAPAPSSTFIVNGTLIDPANVRALVERELRDPDSARYRNVSVHQLPKGASVCGEVNARNAFGGYVGFQRFYIVAGDADVDADPDLAGVFAQGYEMFCERYPAVRALTL